MSNYVVPENDAIQYEMNTTENGWVLSVKVPHMTSVSDQALVLDWLRSYQQDIKKRNPHWLTAFRETEFGYKLVIKRADTVQEVLSAVGLGRSGDRVKNYMDMSFEYAG